jgi:hypothetical protein
VTLQGLTVQVPRGWEARIQQSGVPLAGAKRLPIMHAATVPLPTDRADYGGGVVERLGSGDVFISLVEFGEEAAGTNLYPRVQTLPSVNATMFHPFQLQRRIPGQAGTQIFFTLRERAFCLYVVIGSYSRRIELTEQANKIILGMTVTARA